VNPWKGLNKLPRELWILSVAAFINRSGSMVLPFMAIYANKHLGFSISQAGIILTVYGLAALITAPLVGKLCDVIHPYKVMKYSLALSGLLLFLFPAITNYWQLLGITFIWSILNEAFRPANLVLLSALTSQDQRRIGFALNRLAINLGMSIGPAVGGFLILYNYSLIFIVDGSAHLLSFLFLITSAMKINIAPNKNSKDYTAAENKLQLMSRKKMIFFIISFIPVVMVFFQMMSTFPLFISNELRLPEYIYGMAFTVNTVMIIIIEVPLMNLLAKYSNIKMISVGTILVAVGFGAMAFTTNIQMLFVTVVIWTFGEMITFPASAAYVSEIAPENKRGQFMGYYQMSNNLALSLGPWLGSVVYQNYGHITLWAGTFVFGMLSFVGIKLLEHKWR
jgi:MFS family permease